MDEVAALRREVRRLQLQLHQLAGAFDIGLSVGSDVVTAPPLRVQRAPAGVTGLAAGTSQDVAIVWPRAWADPAYSVIINIVSSTNALGALAATLAIGTKTVAGCTVTVANTSAAPILALGLDVVGIRM